jgi:hypothetical protein
LANVSLRGNEDLRKDLLTAKERDLNPLVQESAVSLDLDADQVLQVETFLNEAWFSGTRTGRAQIVVRAIERRADIAPVGLEEVEADFQALMEESADALNLTVHATINLWDYLGRAWIAGTRTCEAEIMGRFLSTRADVAQEALDWLENQS